MVVPFGELRWNIRFYVLDNKSNRNSSTMYAKSSDKLSSSKFRFFFGVEELDRVGEGEATCLEDALL